MAYEKPAPEWGAAGIEPPESKKQTGWQVEDRPPAAWLNWYMTGTSESIKELQSKAAEKEWVEEQLADIDPDIPDASTTQKGIVQLSSAVDGSREDVAATEKAVKAAYDRADAAFTAASDGKVKVRNAITGAKGTVSDADGDGYPTFDELAAGAATILQGATADANATAEQILPGYTAYVNGEKVTGASQAHKAGDYISELQLSADPTYGSGTELWGVTDLGGAQDIAYDISGNVYVVYSGPPGTKTVRKLNSSGVEVWSLTDVGAAVGVATDTIGNVYIAYATTSGTKNVRKINSSGVEVWSLTDVGLARGITVDINSNIWIAYQGAAGTKTIRRLNSSGTETASNTTYGLGYAIAVDPSQNVYVTYNNTSGTVTLCKYRANITVEWALTDSNYPRRLAVDSLGNVYVTYSQPLGSKTVRKFNSSGAEVWSLTDMGYAVDVALDKSDNAYVVYNFNTGPKFVRRLAPSGKEDWSLADIASGTAIDVDSSGNVYVAYFGGYIRKLNGVKYYKILN